MAGTGNGMRFRERARQLAAGVLGGAALLALSAGCATTAAETAAGRWHELRTPRFQLWTDGDPEQARALVLDLERFHAVMLAKTSAEERSAAPPLRIFLAKDRASFVAWTGRPDHSGLFVATARGNYAMVMARPGVDAAEEDPQAPTDAGSRHVLFHEYTHYMMAAQGARVPSWYNEGFAEYMATTRFRDDGSYSLGCPPRYRTQWMQYLEWLPMARVMEADDVAELVRSSGGYVRTRRAPTDAYAQSWYAVHFLNEDAQRKAQLREYLQSWASGTRSEQTLRDAFGLSYAELDTRIQQYAKQPKLACVAIQPARPFALPVVHARPLSSAEAHYHVGDLMLSLFGPTEAALELLERAVQLEPGDPRAIAAIGRAQLLRAERSEPDAAAALEQAERYLLRAQQRASADPQTLALLGHLHRLRAAQLRARNDERAGAELASARAAYRKAIRADEALAEAYYGLGLTYLIEDNGSKEPVVVLEAAAYLLPLDPNVALAFAQLQIARGNPLQAVPALEHVLSWSKRESNRAQVRKTIAELRASAAATPAAGTPAAVVTPEAVAAPAAGSDDEAEVAPAP
jgi:hypothetical protein